MEALRAPFAVAGQELQISASIGIAALTRYAIARSLFAPTSLLAAIERLKRRLAAEGLFAVERKRARTSRKRSAVVPVAETLPVRTPERLIVPSAATFAM